jgi:glycosyltransferase involved in cell wall biosynthesis
MSQERLFSVIIPTRNRARLLQNALQSVMEQTFDDVEIIVSDNCSHDETPSVVQDAEWAGRIRYVRPERVLAMPDHWEFALAHAKGRFVTYLCDDDAWAPDLLGRVSEVLASSAAQLVGVYSGLYFGSNWLDPETRNVASFAPYTGAVSEYESKETLRKLYSSCRVVYEAPRMLNSFCARDVIRRVQDASGKIFLLCPDYSFSALILTAIPTWLYIDEPLHLQGVFAEGIGSSSFFNRGEAAREFAREFDDSKLLRRVPLQMPVVSNYIAETLLMSKERLPAKLSDYGIDWTQYFINCWDDVSLHERNGVNVANDKEEFWRVIAQHPARVQSDVRLAIQGLGSKSLIKQSVRKLINGSSFLARVESLVRGRNNGSARIKVPGAVAGFDNILDCARQLPGLARGAALTTTGR